jgi:putative oxidoreductase
MTLVRRLARPMLASMFVMGGYSALRNPQAHVRMAGPVTEKLSGAADQATADRPTSSPDEKQLVLINGAAQVIGGLALATNRFPRLASLVLAGSLVPTTAAGHRFWEETDKTQRANQQIHFFKNLSMFGGLLISAVDTEGRPGLAWRTSHAVSTATKGTKTLAKGTKGAAKASVLTKGTKSLAKSAGKSAKGAGKATALTKGTKQLRKAAQAQAKNARKSVSS